MNLSAKSLGRFAMLAVALFFFSCEDETSFLGFKNPNKKFNVSYIEIEIPTSVLSIDSVITDNVGAIFNGRPVNAVGAYTDPLMGTVKAETYLQLRPAADSKFEDNAELDSVTIQLRLNFYSYGFTGAQEMKFNLHEITGEPLSLDSIKRYYSNSNVQYNPDPIGQASIFVDRKHLDTTKQDTVLLIRGRFEQAFGEKILSFAKNNYEAFSDPNLFVQEIKGLVITSAENNGILGFNPIDASSKIVFHYSSINNQNETDTLQRSFVFNKAAQSAHPNFTNYSTDRSATEFSPITQSYQPFPPSTGVRAVQSGSPLITKLDLSKFYEFADTLENVLVNSAELMISNVASPEGMEAHRSLIMLVMNNDNELFTIPNSMTSANLLPYHLAVSGRRYSVNADVPSDQFPLATLFYNAELDQLSSFITLFTQSLFRGRRDKEGNINENRIKYLALFPYSPFMAGSVNRTVFNASNLKLRIHYTMPSAVINNNN